MSHICAVALDPDVGRFERLRLDAARAPLRVAAAGDQAGALEHLQVLRDGRLAHVERLGELVHGRLAEGQPREDRAARGVGQCEEGRVQAVGAAHTKPIRLYNHKVIYESTARQAPAFGRGVRGYTAPHSHDSRDRQFHCRPSTCGRRRPRFRARRGGARRRCARRRSQARREPHGARGAARSTARLRRPRSSRPAQSWRCAWRARSTPSSTPRSGSLARGEAFTADARLSAALRKTVAAEKAFGYTVPAEFGGAGASYGELAAVEETLAANGLGPLAVEISGQLTIGAGSLLAYGDDRQQRTFLPLVAEGRPMAFGLTEVGVGVNAKKMQAYVEEQADGSYRLFAEGSANKLWITNAVHGGLIGIVARLRRDSPSMGLFIVELPRADVVQDAAHDYEFRCEPSGVAAFVANFNSRLHFRNFPLPKTSRIPADGVEVLFYCLRMGRCMLAAMAAGYQRMLARDASHYALRRSGVGGPVIRHEMPRLNLGRILGGALQARSLAYLSLQQDADGVDLAGLRDLTKSAAAGAGVESMLACEHVLGGRAFHGGSRVNEARVNLHLFGVVEGEDDLILMGMVRDVTQRFVERLSELAARRHRSGERHARRRQAARRATHLAHRPRSAAEASGPRVVRRCPSARATEILGARRLGRGECRRRSRAPSATVAAGFGIAALPRAAERRCAVTRVTPSAS